MSHPAYVSKRLARPLGWLLASVGLLLLQPAAHGTDVKVGIEGHYRVGRWTGVRVDGSTSVSSIETRDGDGVEVRYGQPNRESSQHTTADADRIDAGKNDTHRGGDTWNYVIPGSEAAPLIVRDENGIVSSTRFPTIGSPSRGPAMISLDMPWLIVLGDPLGVDEIGANKLLDRDALIAVSRPDSAANLPDSSLGYDGVDMMMIGGSSRPLLSQLSPSQQQAIADWIVDGGRVFLTLGESAPELFESAPWLSSLLPLENLEVVRIDPSSIETYTSSQTPLTPFNGALLPKDVGRVLIMGRTTRRTSTPVAIDLNVGFGRVTIVAADLESEMFATWPERLDLITQITGSILIPNQDLPGRKSRSTAYNDLAGQVRSSLDQFEVKRYFGFSVVSLILMALIAAIGPLDYLLLNRVLGRPLLGWLTFPIIAIGLSAILVYQSRPVTSAESSSSAVSSDLARQCNRIEIIDVDATYEVGRGCSINYLYSHDAIRTNVRVTESEMLDQITQQAGRMLAVPFGYPGESFGGIQIAIEDSRLPVYDVPIVRETNRDGKERLRSSLVNVPLASRSSKGILARSRFIPKLTNKPSIERRPGSELLRGELTNPLPVDLLNGVLIYRNWTYLLPTRFPAHGTIDSVDTLRQKNFRWQLSRQQTLESESETEAWNPADIKSIDRITEMLMFHGAVGGTRYTTLRHEPLSFLDLSHVLTDDRCILMGRTTDPATHFQTTIGDSVEEPPGTRLTIVRVVLPVVDPQRQE